MQCTFWTEIEKTQLDCNFPRLDFLLGNFNVTKDPIDRAPAKLDDQPTTDILRDTRLNWNIQDAWRATLCYNSSPIYTYFLTLLTYDVPPESPYSARLPTGPLEPLDRLMLNPCLF